MMHPLEALTSLDGRYRDKVEPLVPYFSELALIRYRLVVEGEYLVALSDQPDIPKFRRLTGGERKRVRNLAQRLTISDAEIVKAIETQGYGNIKRTNHDVKAVELYMRLRLEATSLSDCLEWIHFALTSEDVNNIAYALMLSDAVQEVLLPMLDQVHGAIKTAAMENSKISMLARTHGQPATPSTFGKEQNIFATRLARQMNQVRRFKILAKLNGASGNYAAHVAAFPEVDWLKFTEQFLRRLNRGRSIKLEPNLVTAQTEPHDTYAELFGIFHRLNIILIDFCQDMWRYISDDWLVQKKEGVGSSTMPHKVNPIDLEQGEGLLGVANALFEFFSRKLPISRLQRDLSDSTVERCFGMAFGFCLVAYKSILRGLGKLSVNLRAISEALQSNPEVITEAIQTILRREGVPAAYDKLKDFSQGRKLTLADIAEFVELLEVKPKVRRELQNLEPASYIGLAPQLALR